MSSFRTLQAQHEALISKAQAGQDVREDAQQFIQDVKASSRQISAANERDQLRANLRYWASYLYEHTGTYPNVDLAPASPIRRSNWMPLAGIGILIFVIAAVGVTIFRRVAAQAVPATELPAATEMPTATEGPAATEMPAATEAPVTEEPISAAPTQGNAISILLTSVQDGDSVSPVTRLSGTYTNLPPDSSIHVLIQPLSKGGVRYPVEKYASVAPNVTSGEWAIEATFGQGAELKEKEEYLISVVAATDEEARQELVAASESGLRDLPSGVIPFPQTVSVSRPAFSAAETASFSCSVLQAS